MIAGKIAGAGAQVISWCPLATMVVILVPLLYQEGCLPSLPSLTVGVSSTSSSGERKERTDLVV